MTEEDADLLFDMKSQFYREFSALVHKYLDAVPLRLREDLKVRLGESSSVYAIRPKPDR